MFEMSDAGEYHGDPVFIRFLIESSSRTDPPGWIIAVTPAFAASSTVSGIGKNASDPSALPFAFLLLNGDFS